MPDEQTSFGVYSVRHPPKASDTRGIPELKRNKRSPTWFTARLLFRAEIKGRRPRKIHTFEESMLLVSGTNEREAMEKAKKLARDKQHSYQNLYKEQVSWKFVKLLELQEIFDEELGDGVEVYSKFFDKRK